MSWNWMPTNMDDEIRSEDLVKRLERMERRLDAIEEMLKKEKIII